MKELNEINLNENDIIQCCFNRIVCNDRCEIFRDIETGDFIIHPNEDEEYFGQQLQDVWKYNPDIQEYKHIYSKKGGQDE